MINLALPAHEEHLAFKGRCLLPECLKERIGKTEFCSKEHFYKFHSSKNKSPDAFSNERAYQSMPGLEPAGEY